MPGMDLRDDYGCLREVMGRVVDYVVVLDEGVRKRHFHEAEKGRVVRFVVQLEVRIQGVWRAAVRYDCSHGFSHRDKYDCSGNVTKTTLELSRDAALTYGDWDINENWMNYREALGEGGGR